MKKGIINTKRILFLCLIIQIVALIICTVVLKYYTTDLSEGHMSILMWTYFVAGIVAIFMCIYGYYFIVKPICKNVQLLERDEMIDESIGTREIKTLARLFNIQKAKAKESLEKVELLTKREEYYSRALIMNAAYGFEVNLSKDTITGGIIENEDKLMSRIFSMIGLSIPGSFAEYRQKMSSHVDNATKEVLDGFFDSKILIEKYENGNNYDEVSFWNRERKFEAEYIRTAVYMFEDANTHEICALVLNFNRTEEMLQDENRNAELKNMIVSADKADRQRAEFISKVSQSIKGPASAIERLAGLIKENDNTPETQLHIDRILKGTDQIIKLVNETVEYGRIASGDIVIDNSIFDFEEVINECIVSTRAALITRNISFEYKKERNGKSLLCGDREHLQQVLKSLFEISMKLTENGGKIVLLTENNVLEDNHANVKIEVSDTGVGMSEEFINDILAPYSNSRYSEKTMFQGIGLSLTIIKNIVKCMGGKLMLSSTEGEGTKYIVDIPFEISESPNVRGNNTNEIHELEKSCILIVEDNEINLDILEGILTDEGVEVLTARDGREAVEVFKKSEEGKIDAILMDIVMPVMNGYDSAKEIRSLQRSDSQIVTIIAISATIQDEDIPKITEAGMDSYMTKPIDTSLLFKILAVAYNDHVKKGLEREEKLQIEADLDTLSGIFNRRAFERVVNDSIEKEDNGAFAIVDIDYFKDINDKYGHIVGDEIIKKVARLLKAKFRGNDVVARIGGDEFAVWFRQIEKDKSEDVVKRFKNLNNELAEFDGKMPPVTLSVGVVFRDGAEKFEAVFRKADIALYNVKESGRNGCKVYEY